MIEQSTHDPRKLFFVSIGETSLIKDLWQCADGTGNDRNSDCHCFERDVAKRFREQRRHDHKMCATKEVGQLLMIELPCKADVVQVSCGTSQLAFVRTCTSDPQ